MIFRNAETGIDNWLVFDDAKNWCHIRRTTTGAEFEFAHGTASGLLTGKDHQNTLEFMNAGEEKNISLNGELLTSMSILREDLPYTMTPVDLFEPSHQTGGMVTTYINFIVWSVQH